jgi:hypothetical protein
MDNLIKLSQFSAPIKVLSNNENIEARLNDVISEAQERYLFRILGVIEYNRLKDADLTGSNEWTRFVNGHTYTKNGKEYRYGGIKNVLLHLIFYDLQRELINDPILRGYSQAEYAEGMKVIPNRRIVQSWNKGVDLLSDYMYEIADYPTVENFLNDFDTDYPDWNYKRFKKINQFNL